MGVKKKSTTEIFAILQHKVLHSYFLLGSKEDFAFLLGLEGPFSRELNNLLESRMDFPKGLVRPSPKFIEDLTTQSPSAYQSCLGTFVGIMRNLEIILNYSTSLSLQRAMKQKSKPRGIQQLKHENEACEKGSGEDRHHPQKVQPQKSVGKPKVKAKKKQRKKETESPIEVQEAENEISYQAMCLPTLSETEEIQMTDRFLSKESLLSNCADLGKMLEKEIPKIAGENHLEIREKHLKRGWCHSQQGIDQLFSTLSKMGQAESPTYDQIFSLFEGLQRHLEGLIEAATSYYPLYTSEGHVVESLYKTKEGNTRLIHDFVLMASPLFIMAQEGGASSALRHSLNGLREVLALMARSNDLLRYPHESKRRRVDQQNKETASFAKLLSAWKHASEVGDVGSLSTHWEAALNRIILPALKGSNALHQLILSGDAVAEMKLSQPFNQELANDLFELHEFAKGDDSGEFSLSDFEKKGDCKTGEKNLLLFPQRITSLEEGIHTLDQLLPFISLLTHAPVYHMESEGESRKVQRNASLQDLSHNLQRLISKLKGQRDLPYEPLHDGWGEAELLLSSLRHIHIAHLFQLPLYVEGCHLLESPADLVAL